MKIKRTIPVEIDLDSEEVGAEIAACKDPLAKLCWLRILMMNLTHEEIQAVRNFITDNGKHSAIGLDWLTWIDQAIDSSKPLIEALKQKVDESRSGEWQPIEHTR